MWFVLVNSWLCPKIQTLLWLLVPMSVSGKSSFRILKMNCSKGKGLFWTWLRNSRSAFWCALALHSSTLAFGLDRVENFEFGALSSPRASLPFPLSPTCLATKENNGDGVGPNCRDKPGTWKLCTSEYFGTKISTYFNWWIMILVISPSFAICPSSAHIFLVSLHWTSWDHGAGCGASWQQKITPPCEWDIWWHTVEVLRQ